MNWTLETGIDAETLSGVVFSVDFW